MRYCVDSSHVSHLPICRDCGWRGMPEPTKIAALVSLQRHQHRAHPGDSETGLRANIARARRAARGQN